MVYSEGVMGEGEGIRGCRLGGLGKLVMCVMGGREGGVIDLD
jgi:hypothetical protein